jgi:hypothetical protein
MVPAWSWSCTAGALHSSHAMQCNYNALPRSAAERIPAARPRRIPSKFFFYDFFTPKCSRQSLRPHAKPEIDKIFLRLIHSNTHSNTAAPKYQVLKIKNGGIRSDDLVLLRRMRCSELNLTARAFVINTNKKSHIGTYVFYVCTYPNTSKIHICDCLTAVRMKNVNYLYFLSILGPGHILMKIWKLIETVRCTYIEYICQVDDDITCTYFSTGCPAAAWHRDHRGFESRRGDWF